MQILLSASAYVSRPCPQKIECKILQASFSHAADYDWYILTDFYVRALLKAEIGFHRQ